MRTGEQSFVITASGVDKGAIEDADLGSVWLDGTTEFQGGRRPSAETPLHAALYARDLDIGAIAHTHSIAATVLSRRALGEGVLVLEGWEMAKGISGVTSHEARVRLPVVANDQDTRRLADAVATRLLGAPGYLLAGHGLYTWGRDLAETARHVDALEFLLECELEQRRQRP